MDNNTQEKNIPKCKWTEKTIEEMWNTVKAENAEMRHTTYDTNNAHVIRAIIKHAKRIYET